MRKFLVVIILICAAVQASAQSPSAKKLTGSPQSDFESEAEILRLYNQFTAAWNDHDVPKMAKMWAEDGDHVEPDGRVAKGRADVEKLLQLQHDTVFKDTQLTLIVQSVWFITNDVALVDGSYTISGILASDGKEIPPRKGHLTSLFLRERSKWWIAASRLMIPSPLPYKNR